MARSFVAASTQYLDYAGAAASAVPLTFACWFYPVSAAVAYGLLNVANSGASVVNGWSLEQNSTGTLRALTGDGSSTVNATTTATVTAGAWNHGAAVFAASNDRRIFVAGANKVTNATARTPTGLNRTTIGRKVSATPAAYMDGRVAEAAIWNVALADADIAVLAKGVSPLLVRPDALLACWPLWGQASPELDLRGAFPLTVTGATAAAHPRVYGRGRRRSIALPPAAGGTTYTLSLSGSTTGSATLARAASTPHAGSLTASATLARLAAAGRSGSATGSATFATARTATQALTGSLTGSGSLARKPSPLLGGSSSATGTVARSASSARAGSATGTGTFGRQGVRNLSGSLAASSTLARSVLRALAGSTAASATLAKATNRGAFAGSTTGSGSLARIKTLLLSFAGATTASGAFVRSVTRPLTGGLVGSGTTARTVARTFAGSSAASGVLTSTRLLFRALAGGLTGASTLARSVGRSLVGSGLVVATLARSVAQRLSGSAAGSGSLSSSVSGAPSGFLRRRLGTGPAGIRGHQRSR